MSSTPKIMSSVTFTRQQMMQAMVRPLRPTHSRKQFSSWTSNISATW